MSQKLNHKEIAEFCEQMEIIFRSGISASEGLSLILEDQTEEGIYKKILQDVKSCMDEVGIFSAAVRESKAFPEYVMSMTELGEQTGNLDEVMHGLAKYYRREDDLLEDIRQACTYPLIMTGMMLVILLILIIKVFPVFESVYEQMGSQMDGIAGVLLQISHRINQYYPICIGVILILAAGAWWMLNTESGRKQLQRGLGHYMRNSTLFYQLNVSRVALIISMGLRSGMDIGGTFDMAKKMLGSQMILQEKLSQCIEKIERGESLGEASRSTGILKGMDARMLRISEQMGASDQALEKISERIDEEVTAKIQNMISKLEPTLVAVLSLLVGIILLSVMLPLMGLLSGIS